MYSGNYTEKGAAGLLKDGGKARYTEAERVINEMGGSLESYYWTYVYMDFFFLYVSMILILVYRNIFRGDICCFHVAFSRHGFG